MNEAFSNIGRRRFLQGAAGLVVGGGFLAACGSDAKPDSAKPAAGGKVGPTEGLIGLTLNGLNDYTKGVATGVYKALEGTKYTLEVVQGLTS